MFLSHSAMNEKGCDKQGSEGTTNFKISIFKQ